MMNTDKSNSKVSVITIVYNGVAHLEQTIQSVINQSYDNIEYIIIDGASTDGSVELIKKYKKNINYWISESDSGIYDAMNKGLTKASGDYIGFINADDWYDVKAVENIINIFKSKDVDVVHGNMHTVDHNQKSFIKKSTNNLDKLKKGMIISFPTVFAKRNLYAQYGMFDTQFKIAADWDMILRWYLNNVEFEAIDKALAYFRMGGVSSVYLKKSFEEKHKIRKKYMTYRGLDYYYMFDILKQIIPSSMLLKISLLRQSKATQ